MNDKKIFVQISEGLGNQMFMFANAYSLSKKLNRKLIIDNISGYKKKKNILRNHQKYMLNHFCINFDLVKNNLLVNFFF